jgi:CIC family chloride channel protein
LREHFSLTFLRNQLASRRALTQLSVLGFASGILTGLVITLFRMTFEGPQALFLPGANTENYEQLPRFLHFLLPFGGAILIGLFFYFLNKAERRVGIAHVIERLDNHQGELPLKSLLVQFLAGALSIMSGHSAGREGAAVHLGAAVSSQLGQKLALPNNAIRSLIGCGTAAAISASFNTPIAGVIFAMEVILKEYTLNSVTPIILASVAGAIVTQFFYGADPAFVVPSFTIGSLEEIPFLMLTGVIIGLLASLLIYISKASAERSQSMPLLLRFSLAGILTGAAAMLVPQIMGIGYDTVNDAFQGNLALQTLCIVAAVKLLVTGLCVGLGLPSGFIGPSLVIGALAGGAIGFAGDYLAPNSDINAGLYAMLGMGAMMGATLQAPLAALTALVELTANTHITMPGMLVIIISNLVVREGFKLKPIFRTLLATQGIALKNHPLSQYLDRSSVSSVMDTDMPHSSSEVSIEEAKTLIASQHHWSLIWLDDKPKVLLSNSDLAVFLEKLPESKDDMTIQLLDIPGQRLDLAGVNLRATLRHALEVMNSKQVEALYIHPSNTGNSIIVEGIITRSAIEEVYRYNKQQTPLD